MKKLLSKIQNAYTRTCQKVAADVTVALTDTSGSDTTEKIGMVVAAVVIVGLLVQAVSYFMPRLFNTMGNSAESTLNNMFKNSTF